LNRGGAKAQSLEVLATALRRYVCLNRGGAKALGLWRGSVNLKVWAQSRERDSL